MCAVCQWARSSTLNSTLYHGDIKAATNVRAIEKSDYDAMHKDYSESVDALQRAIAVSKAIGHRQ